MPAEEVESTETRIMVEEKCKRFSRGGFFLFPLLKFLSKKQKEVIK
ncbi:hypothetical protein C5S32_02360 [ANME-1 cluster archaeon GoMg1]|nr:hypothetical protein [ANME-1 cluster archaeon GoMg1]